jgi:putative Mg2+ transporter-C (MgtC) family protein
MGYTTLDLILRLAVGAILGGIIGLEREYRAKEAGFRTHFLVALGSALFMELSQYGFDAVLGELKDVASYDPSRIASQVVTGIGFIGAGTIIFQKHVVKGLTTAAGLWVTSAIGMTVGAGLYSLAIASTIMVLLCLEAIFYLHTRFGSKNIAVTFSTHNKENITAVLNTMRAQNIDIDSYSMKQEKTAESVRYTVEMELKVKRNHYQSSIIKFMKDFDGVSIETIE